MPDLYFEQEIHKLQDMLTFLISDSAEGEQLRAGLEQIQFHTGLPSLIYDYDFDDYHYYT